MDDQLDAASSDPIVDNLAHGGAERLPAPEMQQLGRGEDAVCPERGLEKMDGVLVIIRDAQVQIIRQAALCDLHQAGIAVAEVAAFPCAYRRHSGQREAIVAHRQVGSGVEPVLEELFSLTRWFKHAGSYSGTRFHSTW